MCYDLQEQSIREAIHSWPNSKVLYLAKTWPWGLLYSKIRGPIACAEQTLPGINKNISWESQWFIYKPQVSTGEIFACIYEEIIGAGRTPQVHSQSALSRTCNKIWPYDSSNWKNKMAMSQQILEDEPQWPSTDWIRVVSSKGQWVHTKRGQCMPQRESFISGRCRINRFPG